MTWMWILYLQSNKYTMWSTATHIITLNDNTHTRTHTSILRLSGFCPKQPGWASNKRNIHSLTAILIINHPLSALSIYCILFNLCAWQSFNTISVQVFFGQPLGLAHSTSYISSHNHCLFFCNICSYHSNQFCCITKIISSNPSLSLNSLLGTLSFS